MQYYDVVPVCNLGLDQGALQKQDWSQNAHEDWWGRGMGFGGVN